ncbi:hypothetical protein SAMN05444392_11018 [Seinonella peptonophila]|uniref:LPXTG-motif cell wall anchor domain-containing protein n=1 Tax=Seinonella peptonophila TaxID=112248 RepID=A0A1M4ZNV4_9BACL|nr:hypothetical protein [Seinonella peptonophila]SHF19482.1 hypothetical protein SAMN05444392_11018 [Seinonella peptonophila]
MKYLMRLVVFLLVFLTIIPAMSKAEEKIDLVLKFSPKESTLIASTVAVAGNPLEETKQLVPKPYGGKKTLEYWINGNPGQPIQADQNTTEFRLPPPKMEDIPEKSNPPMIVKLKLTAENAPPIEKEVEVMDEPKTKLTVNTEIVGQDLKLKYKPEDHFARLIESSSTLFVLTDPKTAQGAGKQTVEASGDHSEFKQATLKLPDSLDSLKLTGYFTGSRDCIQIRGDLCDYQKDKVVLIWATAVLDVKKPAPAPIPKPTPTPTPSPTPKQVSIDVKPNIKSDGGLTVDASIKDHKVAKGKWKVTLNGKTDEFDEDINISHPYEKEKLKVGKQPLIVEFTGEADGAAVVGKQEMEVNIPSPSPEQAQIEIQPNFTDEAKLIIDANLKDYKEAKGKWKVTLDGKTDEFDEDRNISHPYEKGKLKVGKLPLIVEFSGEADGKAVTAKQEMEIEVKPSNVTIELQHQWVQQKLKLTASLKDVKSADGEWIATIGEKTETKKNKEASFSQEIDTQQLKQPQEIAIHYQGKTLNDTVEGKYEGRLFLLEVSHLINKNGDLEVNAKLPSELISKLNEPTGNMGWKLTLNQLVKQVKDDQGTLHVTIPKSEFSLQEKMTLTIQYNNKLDGKEMIGVGQQIIPPSNNPKEDAIKTTNPNRNENPKPGAPIIGGPLPKTATSYPVGMVYGLLLLIVSMYIFRFHKQASGKDDNP